MKKSHQYSYVIMITLFVCTAVQQSTGQRGYVGIGTTSPDAKLTVVGNDATFNGLDAAIKLQNTSSSNAWYLRVGGGSGTATPLNGFSIGDNSSYHFNMASNGNIGLGILPSTARLHVNGEMRIEGNNLLEFGTGIPGKEINAGKIAYNGFGKNALTFTGAGTNPDNRSIYFYAEGGTTMNGPLDFNGPLKINGNPGTAGQVLTSNGTTNPEWRSLSSNNVRFGASFSTDPGTPITTNTFTQMYNTSPTDITISSGSITINKTGVYHIEGYTTCASSFSAAPSSLIVTSNVNIDNRFYIITNGDNMIRTSSITFEYKKTIPYSLELYVEAPAILNPSTVINASPSPTSTSGSGRIWGYLISE